MGQFPIGVGPLTPQSADGQQWMNFQQPQHPHQDMEQQPMDIELGQQQQTHEEVRTLWVGEHPHQGMQQQPMEIEPEQQQQQTHEEVRTLWVGDLQYWMDEAYLHSCFVHIGDVCNVKIIKNKQTGYSEGYGFVEFTSHAAAERILKGYNGSFRLNWASFGIGERRPEAGPEHSIFVGDLAPDVTDYMLQETFGTRYPSVKGAKVVTDANTGRSKSYGFVRFGDEMERNLAMNEMNGTYCSSRPMKISAATPKKSLGSAPRQMNTNFSPAAPASDPNNTTLFVSGVNSSITDDYLKIVFAHFGELVDAKVLLGKGCGFVQFADRACAENALQRLHGTSINRQPIRLSWARSPSKKQVSQKGGIRWSLPHEVPKQWIGKLLQEKIERRFSLAF